MWSLSLITPPSAEPLDLTDDVRPDRRMSSEEAAAQSALLTRAIKSAREACEVFTQRQIITATWELWLSEWFEEGIFDCGRILVPLPPLQSITSITYLSPADYTTYLTWAGSDYVTVAPAGPLAQRAQVFPAYGRAWPSTACQPGAIKVRFVAGYGTAGTSAPGALLDGMTKHVAQRNEFREIQIPGNLATNQQTPEELWWPFRAF